MLQCQGNNTVHLSVITVILTGRKYTNEKIQILHKKEINKQKYTRPPKSTFLKIVIVLLKYKCLFTIRFYSK